MSGLGGRRSRGWLEAVRIPLGVGAEHAGAHGQALAEAGDGGDALALAGREAAGVAGADGRVEADRRAGRQVQAGADGRPAAVFGHRSGAASGRAATSHHCFDTSIPPARRVPIRSLPHGARPPPHAQPCRCGLAARATVRALDGGPPVRRPRLPGGLVDHDVVDLPAGDPGITIQDVDFSPRSRAHRSKIVSYPVRPYPSRICDGTRGNGLTSRVKLWRFVAFR